MTSSSSSSPSSSSSSSADAPLDDLDLGLLDRIREMYQAADPMPADLPERISFLLALRDLEVAHANMSVQVEARSAARSAGTAVVSGLNVGSSLAENIDLSNASFRIDANDGALWHLNG